MRLVAIALGSPPMVLINIKRGARSRPTNTGARRLLIYILIVGLVPKANMVLNPLTIMGKKVAKITFVLVLMARELEVRIV